MTTGHEISRFNSAAFFLFSHNNNLLFFFVFVLFFGKSSFAPLDGGFCREQNGIWLRGDKTLLMPSWLMATPVVLLSCCLVHPLAPFFPRGVAGLCPSRGILYITREKATATDVPYWRIYYKYSCYNSTWTHSWFLFNTGIERNGLTATN